MNYFLFKLRFETAVHFGPSDAALSLAASEEHVRADTLFSALCQTALCLYGPEGVEELCAMATQPDQILAKPGMGVDEGYMIVYNEMQRILALRRAKQNRAQ